jgi:hypothetical protein
MPFTPVQHYFYWELKSPLRKSGFWHIRNTSRVRPAATGAALAVESFFSRLNRFYCLLPCRSRAALSMNIRNFVWTCGDSVLCDLYSPAGDAMRMMPRSWRVSGRASFFFAHCDCSDSPVKRSFCRDILFCFEKRERKKHISRKKGYVAIDNVFFSAGLLTVLFTSNFVQCGWWRNSPHDPHLNITVLSIRAEDRFGDITGIWCNFKCPGINIPRSLHRNLCITNIFQKQIMWLDCITVCIHCICVRGMIDLPRIQGPEPA